jgi:hypothetical protein
VQERYTSAGLPVDWNTPVSGGTLADYVKDQALADTALYAAVENWAERYHIQGKPQESDGTSRLPDLGLSRERMAELERVGWLYRELYALYCTEGSQLAPTEESLRAYGEAEGAVALERILIPAGESRETARTKASELFAQINGAEDRTKAFSTLMEEWGDPAGEKTLFPEPGGETDLCAGQARYPHPFRPGLSQPGADRKAGKGHAGSKNGPACLLPFGTGGHPILIRQVKPCITAISLSRTAATGETGSRNRRLISIRHPKYTNRPSDLRKNVLPRSRSLARRNSSLAAPLRPIAAG